MNTNNLQIATYASIAVIAISLFFIGTELTGYAIDTGIVNVTITSSASINFTTDLLDLGNGTVTPGGTATVSSNSTFSANDQWTGAQAEGQLVLENNGNVNVSLTLETNNIAANFIGGSSPAPSFKLRVTNSETGSCNDTQQFGSFEEVTGSPKNACANLGWGESFDSIIIDAELTIPNNAATGTRQATITATATSL